MPCSLLLATWAAVFSAHAAGEASEARDWACTSEQCRNEVEEEDHALLQLRLWDHYGDASGLGAGAGCTAPGADPYETGSLVECCEGHKEGPKDFHDGHPWHFQCPASSTPAPPTPLPTPGPTYAPGTAPPSLKFMSYNLFGWNAFNPSNKWKRDNIIANIKQFAPDVLGCQEVEQGYDESGCGGSCNVEGVRQQVADGSGLTAEPKSNQWYNSSRVQVEESETRPLRNYWMSMTKYKNLGTQKSFLFFNSHWQHGDATQANDAVNFIKEMTDKYGEMPVVFVGDTNQFQCGDTLTDCESYKIFTRAGFSEVQKHSPGVATYCGSDNWGNGPISGGHPDVMYVNSEFDVVQAGIQYENCCCRDGSGASDHAALEAELTPKD